MRAETNGKEMRRADDTDMLDYLPQEVAASVDRIGYELLERNGYNISNVTESKKAQKRLLRELRIRKQSLEYSLIASASGYSVLRFMLKEGDRIVDKSKGIKFIPNRAEEL